MLRRTLTLTQAFALVLSFAVPTFAGAGELNQGALTLPVDSSRPSPASPYKPMLPGLTSLESRLGFTLGHPLLVFNNTGTVVYTPGAAPGGGGVMVVNADPLALQIAPGMVPVAVLPFAGNDFLSLSFAIDEATGEYLSGIAGEDLLIVGQADVDGNGIPDTAGVLLTAEVVNYMGEDSGGTTDFHFFELQVTGGELASLYPSGRIGINMTSEQSDFTGSYADPFSGEAKGTLGRVTGMPCSLDVDKTCFIPMPDPSDYVCDKPIDSLIMIWDGVAPVRIKAYKGPVGSALLADMDDIQPGEEIAVTGYSGSPNDVTWEVFDAGTSNKIGESEFHLSCSDSEMNGPEDCGLNQGDGKDNDAGLINLWLLEGIVDAGGTLDCTMAPLPGAIDCEFQPFPASCETGDAHFLTFQYTGGGCAASDNDQRDHVCSGATDGSSAVIFTDDEGNSLTLNPGDTVTIPRDDAKDMTLTNAGGTETNVLHVSCSQPLVAGDVYGSLTLVQVDGIGVGTDVSYTYTITNTSTEDIVSLSATDIPLGPIPGAPSSLAAGGSVTLFANAFISETTTNVAIVDGVTADGEMCNDTAGVTVTILPPPPCEVNGEGLFDHFHSDHIKWKLTNNGTFTSTIGSIEISWPAANGELIEVKLDGTIFSGNASPTSVVLDANDWINDPSNRQIAPGDTKALELKFANDIVGSPGDYQITVNLDEGCSVTWQNIGLPFECNTDITELTMIWDGVANPVRVVAYYGNVGSTVLLDHNGVAVGDEVTVSGYADSQNDVFWQVYFGTALLGESKFHLSCSDNDMNGAEDCGKRQGNGKGNDDGLINDWILEGMVDADGPFDCSNLP